MLRKIISFEVPLEVAAARVNVVNWLQSIGYRLTTPPFLTDLEFERGSVMGNMSTVDPHKWRSVVKATFRAEGAGRTKVDLGWEIATLGQIVTKLDIAYWRSEIAASQAAAEGRAPDRVEFDKGRRAATNGYLWRVAVLTFAMLLPLATAVAAPQFSVMLFALVPVFGIAVYYSFRAPRRL